MHLPERLRVPDAVNRQGSGAGLDPVREKELLEAMHAHQRQTWALYQRLIEEGVAREIAREVLPLSLYTQFYWTVNARSLMNFIDLRAEAHAQQEIRAYAVVMMEVFREKMPWTFDAFREHILGTRDFGME